MKDQHETREQLGDGLTAQRQRVAEPKDSEPRGTRQLRAAYEDLRKWHIDLQLAQWMTGLAGVVGPKGMASES